eukprot:m.247567 g.247567  ORF g.247567 m.247567 type:complete len:68 (-) comp33857_c2_seq1:42-245(-)
MLCSDDFRSKYPSSTFFATMNNTSLPKPRHHLHSTPTSFPQHLRCRLRTYVTTSSPSIDLIRSIHGH